MKYTIKNITLPSREEAERKKRMIDLNRRLRGDNRVLGGDTSSVVCDVSESTASSNV